MPNDSDYLVPVKGCWVYKMGHDTKGVVVDRDTFNPKKIKVDWYKQNSTWENIDELSSGFDLGWAVQDIPASNTRRTLGSGRVVACRSIAGREQILVQFDKDGHSVWLPYENLCRIKDVRLHFLNAESTAQSPAMRFRLKLMAHALENWNHLTGSLDRLDVDPLPHQIQLVHRILSSGNYNWIIADDVGLGKTIEMGLVLAGLSRRGYARRILIICPAGLLRQWQDELQYKFEQKYHIYRVDFAESILDNFDKVIVSIDTAKQLNHLQYFEHGDDWDVIIFDEGHKLTRYSSGQRTQRFQLAEKLRARTDAFFLMTGTPHQGYHDKFVALLQLVRPDLTTHLRKLHHNSEIVGEIILRNRRSDVTDAEGNFIFKGLNVQRVPVEPSRQTEIFQRKLNFYLKNGYKAGEASGKRAIGFVMTTYRKLASSSIAAIEIALRKRKQRLIDQFYESSAANIDEDQLEALIDGGDDQDSLVTEIDKHSFGKFFHNEDILIDELLNFAFYVREKDEKLNLFLNKVAQLLVSESKKLLVFTEYLATQEYLKVNLEERFPETGEVLLINGSMSLDQKLKAISRFNNQVNSFLVSTEAGGEGLNLHNSCHVMVNYDLPWNPARLLQRMGRLYRYGQQHPVIVINLHARDSFDNQVIDLMLMRVSEIVFDMATVGEEFNERLYADILGDVLDNLDFGEILRSASSMEIERTSEEIENALQRAKVAKGLQDELLTSVAPYDPKALVGSLGMTMKHAEIFIRGMLPEIEVDIELKLHSDRVLEIRLPENLRGMFKEFQNRTVVRITTDRRLAQKLQDVVLLDFENSFFQHLINTAKSHDFDGLYASVRSQAVSNAVLVVAKLRWQNDQGKPGTEEFVTACYDEQNGVKLNPAFLSSWLLEEPENVSRPKSLNIRHRNEVFNFLQKELEQQLQNQCNKFKHPNSIVPLAIAEFSS